MAKPRIFLSSTYYDLKQVRTDIERFIKEQGYEAVLNERGSIPYGSDKKLEEYCYKEIEICDILVSIVGGRFGSQSQHGNHSISNLELKTAIEKGRQVYIFIEKNVLAEYNTYTRNKGNETISYAAVDDHRVYKFIEDISSLPLNNQISSFEVASDITQHLKEQWAGLFQRLLSEAGRQKEISLIESLAATSKTLNQTVQYLINEKSRGNQAIKEILLSNHPAFESIRKKLNLKFRVFFQNKHELAQLLIAMGYEEGDELLESWAKQGFYSWRKNDFDEIYISEALFDDEGKLKQITPIEWNESWVEASDDIPF